MPETPTDLMPGVQFWKNPGNQFAVFRLHYTADPAKRTPQWLAAAKAGMPQRGWKRELEIDFAAPEGDPVVPEFDVSTHVREIGILPGCRTIRGWDPGFVSPAVVIGQLSPLGQVRIYDEVIPFNTTLDELVPQVRAITMARGVEYLNPFDAGDPAAGAETDLGCVKTTLASKYSIFLWTTPKTQASTEASYTKFRQMFLEHLYVPGAGQEPKIVIHPRCTTLVKALSGAFHLSTTPPYSVVKEHPYKDVVDAFRYLCDNLAQSAVTFQRDLREMARVDWAW